MDKEFAIEKSLEIVKNAKIAMLGTTDQKGYPNIKAMLNLHSEGLKDIWFSTNTSSKRVADIMKNPKTCVYYMDEQSFMGLMLVGEIEVIQDDFYREKLWFEGCERYYKKGIGDPDYTVLHFRAHHGNFYYRLKNLDFNID